MTVIDYKSVKNIFFLHQKQIDKYQPTVIRKLSDKFVYRNDELWLESELRD